MTANIDQSSQVQTRTGIVTMGQTVLDENLNRRGLILQNLGTSPLYVKFGENCTDSDFDVVLGGGAADLDGNGVIMSYDVLSYTGVISVFGTSTVSCTATEL